MTEQEAAEHVGLRESTLRAYRHSGNGPQHTSTRVGHRVLVTYDQADLDLWQVRRTSSLGSWRKPRAEGEPPRLGLDARGRELAREYTAAEARVEERLALWRAVYVEPHVACIRLRAEAAALGSGLARLERRLAVLLERLTPEAIDARADAARSLAQEREVSRRTAMLERRQARRAEVRP